MTHAWATSLCLGMALTTNDMEHSQRYYHQTPYGGVGDMVANTQEDISNLRRYVVESMYDINKKLEYIIRLLEDKGFIDEEAHAKAKEMADECARIMTEYKVENNE